jgi:peptidyl-prolyl cis-trans isomerase B (cyclophilin B)
MATRAFFGGNRLGGFAIAALVLAAGTLGCGGKSHSGGDCSDASSASASRESPGAAVGSGKPASSDSSPLARYRQSFQEATREDVPADCEKPPLQTSAGKSVGVLYEKVRKTWDDIKLVSDDGKLLIYRVTFDTDQGEIEIELHPDWAPNHVRSFLALAKVGYYDGLAFDRRIQQISETPQIPTLNMVEAGCPMGLGMQEYGSIGYWLKAEFDPKLKHEEGTVGAWHSMDPDTAACRFYVCLSDAPTLDGRFTIFGKVSGGLDAARKMFNQPHRISDDDEEGCHRFDKPPVIRKVVVHPPVVDKPIPVAIMEKGN